MTIAWPEGLCPSEMTWGVVYNNRAFTSTLSNAQQIVGYPGAYWQCQLTFSALTREEERILTAFIGRLQGMFNTFNLPAFTRKRTDSIGAPVVVTAVAQASSMRLGGVTPSKKVFLMGDYITIGGVMFEVVDDATSNAAGEVVVNVNKPIRKNIAVGAVVEYKAPYAEMRRTSDTHALTVRPLVANGALEFREAF
ncbi:hypothetical protein IR016_04910 [Pseudomonas putida]|uniref:hypothetical protein n=1 Tax=Pseudomonas putida TaxID=303 RepID=UPI0018AA4902|nr:hypothetical protein [Pseudomonas putida]MBF8706128.1 hypothetical protein [Pseudomonas putida]